MAMTREEFESRVKDCTWALSFGGGNLDYLKGAKFLDIGSGYGSMAIACERAGVAEYLGVEPWPFGASVARLDGIEYGARLCYEQLMPGERRDNFNFFEGFLEKVTGRDNYYDVAMLFDVLEHIPDASSIARTAFSMMRPGGIIIAVTGPLYLSAQGHHLWGTPAGDPWAHLKPGYNPTLNDTSPYRLQNYLELGKCTHEDIKGWFTSAGFEIAKENIQKDTSDTFRQHKNEIAPEFLERHPEERFIEVGSEFIFRKPEAKRAVDAPAHAAYYAR